MRFLFFLLFFIFLIPAVFSGGFSPTSLTFDLEKGEKQCGTINIDSESDSITITDKWAANKDQAWTVNGFENSAAEHKLTVNYDNSLSVSERQVEVCVSGENEGEYHGVLILRQGQEGNSIVQFAVWLKAVIGDKDAPTPVSSNSGSSGGSGTSGSGSSAVAKTEKEETNVVENNIQELSNTEVGDGSKITGNIINKEGSNYINYLIPALVIVGLVILSLIVYQKRRRDKIWGKAI